MMDPREFLLSDQELQRRSELKELRALGVDPYPAEGFAVNITSHEIQNNFEEGKAGFENCWLAGRLVNKRIMGKASFAELEDGTGRIQLYVNRDELCPDEDKALYNQVFKKLTSLGDIVGISGHAFITQTGEKSVFVKSFKILSKVLRPIEFRKEADGKII